MNQNPKQKLQIIRDCVKCIAYARFLSVNFLDDNSQQKNQQKLRASFPKTLYIKYIINNNTITITMTMINSRINKFQYYDFIESINLVFSFDTNTPSNWFDNISGLTAGDFINGKVWNEYQMQFTIFLQ